MNEVELWLSRNLKNYENRFSVLSESDKNLIIEWLSSSERPSVLTKISVPHALEKSRRWKSIQEYRKKTIEDFSSLNLEREVEKNGKKFRWVRLGSYQNYLREGTLMQHCVEEYFKSKHSFIYSLRDERNHPHATLELDPSSNQFFQIKGVQNRAIKKEFHDLVKDFIDFQFDKNYTTIASFLSSLQDLGNFNHLCYNQNLISAEELQNMSRLEDHTIVANNLTLETFPEEVEGELLYLKNIKGLKELNLNAKVKTLIISNCQELEKISFLTPPENLIIDHCLKLSQTPYRLELKKVIISRCPKLKQIAQVLVAEKCMLIKSKIDSVAEKVDVKELILFNVKLESFASEFKVKKLLFSHLSPQSGQHFKPYFMSSDSCVERIKILNYEDLLDYYAFAQNYPDTLTLLKLAQGEAEGLISNHLNSNLARLDELTLVLSNVELNPDSYSRFKAFWREFFKR